MRAQVVVPCPCCGRSVRAKAGSEGTHFYEPVATEADRYRAALERIESHGAGEAVRIAREALTDGA